ncbi:MAG TPA: choice-of-anchor C family protein [Candidatus Elarobacter sp.]|jgi:choice-of-anchor C domain-containing protein
MQVKRLAVVLSLGLCTAAAARGADADLVVNGSFEDGGAIAAWTSLGAGSRAVRGWRVTSGTAALVGRYWQAASGSNSLEVGSPGAGAVEQTLATVAGRRYRLTFALAGNPDGPPRIKTLVVTAGASTGRFTFDSASRTRAAMGWMRETLEFTGTGSATTIRFARVDGGAAAWYGPVIDDVAVTEPGSGTATATAAPAAATAAPVPATIVPARSTAAPQHVKTTAPVATANVFTPTGSDPYSGLWMAAYPGRSLRLYVDHHGTDVSAHAVDGGAAFPTGSVAFTGRVDHAPAVVLAKCIDADARGWHGAVIEWTGQDAFHLRVANCHAGDVLFTRLRPSP